MKRTLGREDLLTFFSVFECCEARQIVTQEAHETCSEITCAKCGEPAMFRGTNGLWYSLQGRIFE